MYPETEEEKIKYQKNIKEIEKLLQIQLSESIYCVDPNKYNGIPYPVPKDTSFLAKEEGVLYQQLEQLWFDGIIDLKKKNELRSVINKEYARMKTKASKPQQDSKEVVECVDELDELRRRKYGYFEMSESEQEEFDKLMNFESLFEVESEVIEEESVERHRRIM